MGCCNVRTLSWIVASLNLVFGILGTISLIAILCLPKHEQEKAIEELKKENDGVSTYHQIIYIICTVLMVPFAITLMVGISKNRYKLFVPYIYLSYVVIAITIIVGIHSLAREIRQDVPIGSYIGHFVLQLIGAGIGALFLWPVYILYKQLRTAPVYPEQHDLRTNQPVNKPYYVQGGQI